MTEQGAVVVVIGSLIAAAVVISMTRRQKLTVGFGVFWLVAFLGAALLGLWTGALRFVTQLVGAKFPVSAMTLVGFVTVLGILVYFSVKLSWMHQQIVHLSRYVAMLELRLTNESAGIDKGNANHLLPRA